MSYLKLFLESRGYHVEVPLLPGHGTNYRDLKKVRWQDYIEVAELKFAKLKEESDQIFIGGLCLGAVIALHLATKYSSEISGVIPISTTLFFDGWSLPYIARFPELIRYTPAYYFYDVKEDDPFGIKNEKIRKWISHAMTEDSQTHYSRVPYKSVWELHLLAQVVISEMKEIRCPVLAIHPIEDEVASLSTVECMQRNIEKTFFSSLLLKDSYHLATLDQEKELVANSIDQFCSRLNLKKIVGF